MAAAYDPLTIPSTPIHRMTIEGNVALSDEEIEGRMDKSRSRWFRGGQYRQRWLEKDLEEVIRYYGNLGYLDAQIVEKEVTWSRDREWVTVRIVVEEGTRTVLDTLRFEGLPDVPREGLIERLGLQVGEPFNRDLLGRDRIRIYTYLAERGYAEAEVEHEEILHPGRAVLVYRVQPGRRLRIGPISVVGTKNTKRHFITRELTFGEGEWYNRTSLLESRDRIYQTGLYYNVAMTRERAVVGDALPIRIDVKEREDVRWFGFGGGFGTEDYFRLSVDWNNRNLLRTGRRVTIEGILSELLSDRDVEQRYSLTLVEPWVVGTRTTGILKLTHEQRNVENFTIEEDDGEEKVVEHYRLDQTTASFSLSRELSKITKWWVTYSLEWADADDPSEPIDPVLLRPDVTRSLSFSFERDGRDHLLDPMRGSRQHASIEVAGNVLGGDNEFVKGVAGTAAYRTLRGRVVLAGRVQVGAITSLATDDALPDYKRFRIGGANTVRGYREETIGPDNAMLLANVELRYHLLWRFGGVLFLDGGNTWDRVGAVSGGDFTLYRDLEDTNQDDFRYGTGGGLRIYTPVGPLRIDYARKLKRRIDENGDPEGVDSWHFSIGQAF